MAESEKVPPVGRTYPLRRGLPVVREAEDTLEDEEMSEVDEIPEQDRRLEVSETGRRLGEGVSDGEDFLFTGVSVSASIVQRSRCSCSLRVKE